MMEMRLWTAGLLALLGHLALAGAWNVNFKRTECYLDGLDNLDDRMPVNMANLVSLVEKMEGDHTYMNPDSVAEALIHRYRIDGITYADPITATFWNPNDQYEVDKDALLRNLVTMDQTVPAFTYEPREECTLHFMLSHSVDLYPHGGLDYVWDNTDWQRRRRRRRDLTGQQGRGYGLPINTQPAEHPIENGVIWTPAGPVAAGTLLAGIMVTDTSTGKTISEIYQGQNLDFMPSEMQAKRVMPLHAATLAGDIGQSAIVGYVVQVTNTDIFLGPRGLFANSTAAPKLFTLNRSYNLNIPYLTRAEVFAGIDSLLIQKVLGESSSNQLSLSEALRMYYSNHGLPGYPDYRACNRMEAFKSLDRTVIEEQALHFMYAYIEKIPKIRGLINENKDDFPTIEGEFKSALTKAWSAFTNLVDNYDYTDYDRCPSYSTNHVMTENEVDLLMVYSHEGGETEMQKQRDSLAHLGQLLDVGVDRSRIGVLDGKTATWHFPMTNFSNVADWGSNFSQSTEYNYGSGSDMAKTMAALTTYYFNFYNHLWSDASNASAHAQVVLWNVPNTVQNQEDFTVLMKEFRLKYPDVYFLFAGKSKNSFTELMLDSAQDFFVTSEQDMVVYANTLFTRISELPSLFTYPSCNPDNANFTNIAESSHVYTGYISPNYTTYIKIAPHYFRFSEKVVLTVSQGDVTVCGSRTSVTVDTSAGDVLCSDKETLEWMYLCGRYIEECYPIYLSVSASSGRTNSYCQDVDCQYPNQIKFELQHDGMTCGGAWTAPPPLLLVLVAALAMFLKQQP